MGVGPSNVLIFFWERRISKHIRVVFSLSQSAGVLTTLIPTTAAPRYAAR
jgi:hypothetical protein